MAGHVREHDANRAPISAAQQATQKGVQAAQTHQEAATERQTANQQQQSSQQQATSTLGGFADRAAGLAVITVPLSVFSGLTDLGSLLPGEAGASMAKMNADATKMEQAFAQMEAQMAQQVAEGASSMVGLESDQQRIQSAKTTGDTAQAQMAQAVQGASQVQAENEKKHKDASAARDEAAQQKEALGDAAQQKQAQVDALSNALPAWATEHKAARDAALQETEERLKAQGYVTRRNPPG
jgi:hypothetical protein